MLAVSDGVTVTFEIRLKPEAVETFIAMDPEILAGTARFPGCQGIRIVQHRDEPTRFLFVERWRSEEDYQKYLEWRTDTGQLQSLQAIATSISTDVWPGLVIEV